MSLILDIDNESWRCALPRTMDVEKGGSSWKEVMRVEKSRNVIAHSKSYMTAIRITSQDPPSSHCMFVAPRDCMFFTNPKILPADPSQGL